MKVKAQQVGRAGKRGEKSILEGAASYICKKKILGGSEDAGEQ